MRSDIRFFGFLPILVVLTMCSPVHPPQPQPDPVHEQITILQKQLLELQIQQKETETKLNESRNALDMLSARIKAVEERSSALNRPQAGVDVIKTENSEKTRKKSAPFKQKKKTSAKKKKKKPRRQE